MIGIEKRRRDLRQMVTAGREVWRHRRQIRVRADVQNQVHSDDYVEEEVAMEEPVT